jgi:translation initiation factor 1
MTEAGRKPETRLVYSSEHGRICPQCGNPIPRCSCRSRQEGRAGDGVVRIYRETKGRKGKGVTVVSGIPLAGDALKQLAGRLKARCGCGGTVRNGTIEIQGDHRDLLAGILKEAGYKVKLAGG